MDDLGERLATELDHAGGLLEDLGVTLCLDSVVFDRHAEALQRFDLVTQMVREVARALRTCRDGADLAAVVRLDNMIARMSSTGAGA